MDSSLGASRFALRVPCFIDNVISAMRQMGASLLRAPHHVDTLTAIYRIVDMAFEGIFWRPASYTRRKELTATLDRDPNSVDFSRERPADIASLLKQFFCGLPDPLLTVKLQGLFIAAAGGFKKSPLVLCICDPVSAFSK